MDRVLMLKTIHTTDLTEREARNAHIQSQTVL